VSIHSGAFVYPAREMAARTVTTASRMEFPGTPQYSDTSANEDNSFRNYIR